LTTFIDFTKIDEIRLEMTVEVKTVDGLTSIGTIVEILSKNDTPEGLNVLLDNGDSGNIIKIVNSLDYIKKRILTETHNSENKFGFYEDVMRNEVIPKTIQSFLNSDGGYLYLGVFDDGKNAKEKLIGLASEKKILEDHLIKTKKMNPDENLSDEKFQDYYVSDIENTLEKLLVSDTNFGPLLEYEFRIFDGVFILEINIKRSDFPVFYKHWSKKNKEIEFDIFENGEKITTRKLDYFAYRDGSRKVPVDTFENFYKFLKKKSK
jgi:hypothetical protein